MSAATRAASTLAGSLTEEQRDILREATAYRFPRFSIGYAGGGDSSLYVSASTLNQNRQVWKSHRLATGTFGEMQRLRETAMAEYDRLTKGSK